MYHVSFPNFAKASHFLIQPVVKNKFSSLCVAVITALAFFFTFFYRTRRGQNPPEGAQIPQIPPSTNSTESSQPDPATSSTAFQSEPPQSTNDQTTDASPQNTLIHEASPLPTTASQPDPVTSNTASQPEPPQSTNDQLTDASPQNTQFVSALSQHITHEASQNSSTTPTQARVTTRLTDPSHHHPTRVTSTPATLTDPNSGAPIKIRHQPSQNNRPTPPPPLSSVISPQQQVRSLLLHPRPKQPANITEK